MIQLGGFFSPIFVSNVIKSMGNIIQNSVKNAFDKELAPNTFIIELENSNPSKHKGILKNTVIKVGINTLGKNLKIQE